MSVSCLECRGACCEEIVLNAPPPENDAAHEWLLARGAPVVAGLYDQVVAYALPSRCPLLTPDGLCSVHGTERQPQWCIDAEPGAPSCLGSISRRRTPEQAARIAKAA